MSLKQKSLFYIKPPLTLSGMEQGIFTPMSLLDHILSAEFFSKISKLFWRWKLRSIGLFWHPAQLIESFKSHCAPLNYSFWWQSFIDWILGVTSLSATKVAYVKVK